MEFSGKIIDWYQTNKRDLPWRKTSDPYLIWLSEIILQQTRVDQGINYFLKFKDKYPTIDLLAKAKEEEVLKLWQGLGYYSRARNLHQTAQLISTKYNNSFPNNYEDIINLKGIGEYTAAAISSFCFNNPYPVIDGNVYRVLSRIFGLELPIDSTQGKKAFKELANELIDQKNAATYNQAIMEFGALQCTPKNPNCNNCVFNNSCYALDKEMIDQLPRKSKKITIKNRYFNYLVFNRNEKVYLKKRNDNDIWKGLFDFPLIETKKQIENYDTLLNTPIGKNLLDGTSIKIIDKSNQYKHVLSHQRIYATFWKLEIDNNHELPPTFIETVTEEISRFAVPKLIDNYIKKCLYLIK